MQPSSIKSQETTFICIEWKGYSKMLIKVIYDKKNRQKVRCFVQPEAFNTFQHVHGPALEVKSS